MNTIVIMHAHPEQSNDHVGTYKVAYGKRNLYVLLFGTHFFSILSRFLSSCISRLFDNSEMLLRLSSPFIEIREFPLGPPVITRSSEIIFPVCLIRNFVISGPSLTTSSSSY